MMTLQQIRDQSPCIEGWTKLLKSLGNPPMDTVISLGDVAVSNGADDAWWCVRALDWDNEQVRQNVIKALLLAVQRAAVHTKDAGVHYCISTIQDWVNGKLADLEAGAAAAGAAARAAGAAAKAAAKAAAGAAARAAAWGAWGAAYAEEKETQRADFIAAFPPLILK